MDMHGKGMGVMHPLLGLISCAHLSRPPCLEPPQCRPGRSPLCPVAAGKVCAHSSCAMGMCTFDTEVHPPALYQEQCGLQCIGPGQQVICMKPAAVPVLSCTPCSTCLMGGGPNHRVDQQCPVRSLGHTAQQKAGARVGVMITATTSEQIHRCRHAGVMAKYLDLFRTGDVRSTCLS